MKRDPVSLRLFVAVVETGAIARAAERERLAGIDRLMPAGMEKLRDDMKADGSVTPEKAAVRFLEASNAARDRQMQGIKDADQLTSVPASPRVDGGGQPAPAAQGGEDAWKKEFAAGKTGFVAEADYLAYKKAEARGAIRITGSA